MKLLILTGKSGNMLVLMVLFFHSLTEIKIDCWDSRAHWRFWLYEANLTTSFEKAKLLTCDSQTGPPQPWQQLEIQTIKILNTGWNKGEPYMHWEQD